jgi:hypothetical protein
MPHRLSHRALPLLHPVHSSQPLHKHATSLRLQRIRRRLIWGIFLRILCRGQGRKTREKSSESGVAESGVASSIYKLLTGEGKLVVSGQAAGIRPEAVAQKSSALQSRNILFFLASIFGCGRRLRCAPRRPLRFRSAAWLRLPRRSAPRNDMLADGKPPACGPELHAWVENPPCCPPSSVLRSPCPLRPVWPHKQGIGGRNPPYRFTFSGLSLVAAHLSPGTAAAKMLREGLLNPGGTRFMNQ